MKIFTRSKSQRNSNHRHVQSYAMHFSVTTLSKTLILGDDTFALFIYKYFQFLLITNQQI